MAKVLTLIPARYQASRLPGKPLLDIAGEPMIVHVWRRAIEADLGRVAVATDNEEIAEAIENAGGQAIMTRSDHISGTDRINEAAEQMDPGGNYDTILNLQGDLPTLDPELIRVCAQPVLETQDNLSGTPVDISTLGVVIQNDEERTNPNVVKIVATPSDNNQHLRALYFTRAQAPYGDGPLYHHIGIYAFRRPSLRKFVGLPPSGLEKREKLEQLRALENGMRIAVTLVDTVPLGVDTPDDLQRAREILCT